LLAAVVQTTGIIVVRTVTTIKLTDAITMNADIIVAIKKIGARTTLIVK
jgi:hypothetical protein